MQRTSSNGTHIRAIVFCMCLANKCQQSSMRNVFVWFLQWVVGKTGLINGLQFANKNNIRIDNCAKNVWEKRSNWNEIVQNLTLLTTTLCGINRNRNSKNKFVCGILLWHIEWGNRFGFVGERYIGKTNNANVLK